MRSSGLPFGLYQSVTAKPVCGSSDSIDAKLSVSIVACHNSGLTPGPVWLPKSWGGFLAMPSSVQIVPSVSMPSAGRGLLVGLRQLGGGRVRLGDAGGGAAGEQQKACGEERAAGGNDKPAFCILYGHRRGPGAAVQVLPGMEPIWKR